MAFDQTEITDDELEIPPEEQWCPGNVQLDCGHLCRNAPHQVEFHWHGKCLETMFTVCQKCGVSGEVECWLATRSLDSFECGKPCNTLLTCGHVCPKKCHESCLDPKDCVLCVDDRKKRKELYIIGIQAKEENLKQHEGYFKEIPADRQSIRLGQIRSKLKSYGSELQILKSTKLHCGHHSWRNWFMAMRGMEDLVDVISVVFPCRIYKQIVRDLVRDHTLCFNKAKKPFSLFEKWIAPNEAFEKDRFGLLICLFQPGRVVNVSERTLELPKGFDCTYHVGGRFYDTWSASSLLPVWFLEVKMEKHAPPLYWQLEGGEMNIFLGSEHFILKTLLNALCCGNGRDGSGLWLSSCQSLQVERTENEKLWTQYAQAKVALQKKFCSTPFERLSSISFPPKMRLSTQGIEPHCLAKHTLDEGINEVFLFHGTKSKCSADNIRTVGFDCDFAYSGLYGKGIYFAEIPCKAAQYVGMEVCRYMFLSRVLLGKIKIERHHTSKPLEDNFDSVLGLWGVHREFVVYENARAFPEYLLTFYT